MNSFFLPHEAIQINTIIFPQDRSHQIMRVLRLQAGEHVYVLDNRGNRYLTELITVDPLATRGRIIQQELSSNEPVSNLHLFVAITQRDKLEWIFQKCTEIGVNQFTPVVTRRSLSQETVANARKQERWTKIVMEAAEQSQRDCIPEIHPTIPLANCLSYAGDYKLVAYENEKIVSIPDALPEASPANVAILVGPEGGFSVEEIVLLDAQGWRAVSLGRRVLRMETAAIVACTLILHHLGEMGI